MLLAVLGPAMVSLAFGTLGIPFADDWAYRLTATRFASTGHLVFTGWSAMTLIGQVCWSWPFLRTLGNAGWVLPLSTTVLSSVGLLSGYLLAREMLQRRWAAVALFVVIAAPGFAFSTATFMTDIPTFTAEIACLAVGVAAVQRQGLRRWALLAAAMAIGLWGFSIREFALAAPLAVLVWAAISDRQTQRRLVYLAVAAFEVGLCGVVFVASHHIPGAITTSGVSLHPSGLESLSQASFTLALFLSPAVALSARHRLRPRVCRGSVIALLTAGFGLVIWHVRGDLFVGNYLNPQGMTGANVIVGGRPTVIPSFVWHLLQVVSLISAGLMAWLAHDAAIETRQARRLFSEHAPVNLLVTFVVLMIGELVVYGLTFAGFYDRYLWPLLFVLAVLLLRPSALRRRRFQQVAAAVSAALYIVIGLVTLALGLNADAFDAARWDAGRLAVGHGVRPGEVDAGFEWVGAHASGFVRSVDALPQFSPEYPAWYPWYTHMRPGFFACAIVAGAAIQRSDSHRVATVTYDLFGITTVRSLYVYVSSAPRCKPPQRSNTSMAHVGHGLSSHDAIEPRLDNPVYVGSRGQTRGFSSPSSGAVMRLLHMDVARLRRLRRNPSITRFVDAHIARVL